MNQRVRRHFDAVASDYDNWKGKAHHYYGFVTRRVGEAIPRGQSVAEVGCGTGDILASLGASDGLGVDLSSEMVAIAAAKHPSLRFQVHDITVRPLPDRFDYVVAVDLVEHTLDLDSCFKNLAGSLSESGRLVVVTANPRWSWVLHTAERLRLKMPEGDHVWRSREALLHAAESSGLREISFTRDLLVPKNLPLLRRLDTAESLIALRQRMGLVQRAVFERRS
ncbi:MAG: class I SAM-dependent methyltransferase [Actinomycetota bacterium]